MAPIIRTLVPGFGAIKHDRERLTRTFLQAQQTMAGILMPVGVGLALLAPEFITLLVGAKWLPSLFAMRILVLATTIRMFTTGTNGLCISLGETRAVFIRTFIVTCFAWIAIYVGISTYGSTEPSTRSWPMPFSPPPST